MPQLNDLIDHTLLKPEATAANIHILCNEALTYGFATVCILPTWVRCAAEILKGSPVKVCTVVGFPLGGNTSEAKLFEASQLVGYGAQEIDMVINIGALKSKDFHLVQDEIHSIVTSIPSAIVKVIIETCLLTDEEKTIACQLSKKAGAHFVKTSTGFGKSGATPHDVALMRGAVGSQMGVKASGGIRDYETALVMLKAGASRLGTSSGVAIIEKQRSLL